VNVSRLDVDWCDRDCPDRPPVSVAVAPDRGDPADGVEIITGDRPGLPGGGRRHVDAVALGQSQERIDHRSGVDRRRRDQVRRRDPKASGQRHPRKVEWNEVVARAQEAEDSEEVLYERLIVTEELYDMGFEDIPEANLDEMLAVLEAEFRRRADLD
jgi:hypothetical protein